MKKTLQEEKQRILQLMCRINEQAFNDDGEPLMTHNQFNDYSEPSEPENIESDYQRDITIIGIIRELESHFSTIIPQYGNEFVILTKPGVIGKNDMTIWIKGNKAGATRLDGGVFEENYIDEIDPDELIKFFEPYKDQMLDAKEASKQLEKDSLNSMYDFY